MSTMEEHMTVDEIARQSDHLQEAGLELTKLRAEVERLREWLLTIGRSNSGRPREQARRALEGDSP